MSRFCLHCEEQHFPNHGDVSLSCVVRRIGVVVGLAPVAVLHGCYTAGSGTGGSASVVGEGTGKSSRPLDNAVSISIVVCLLPCNCTSL